MIYVIAAELDQPDRTGPRIRAWIGGQFASWSEPLPHLWIVDGAIAGEHIRTALAPQLTTRDRLVIIKAATEALWQGIAGDAAQWLAENFPGSITERVAGKTEGLLPE